jgi:ABC-type multidrug transport system fused ATPase/permease subunit
MPKPNHPEANPSSTASKSGDSRMSDKAPTKKQEEKPTARSQDEDVVGKVYDGRLMRRLVTYLRPYKLQTAVSAACILLRSFTDVAGPLLVKVAVDTYMTPNAQPSWASRHLSRQPIPGVTELAGLYLLTLGLSFLLDFVQTYLMQWTGQKIMFDMRREIFRHIQLQDVAFFDRNPVGRLVTRVTSDVDALNEMFTSGVLEIFGNVVMLAFIVVIMLRMNWPVALLTLSTIPLIVLATNLFRKAVRSSYRQQRAATARINAFTQEYVSGMSVVQLFNREKRAFHDFSNVNLENKNAWADAITAYAIYYPVVEFLSSLAIAFVLWQGGLAVMHNLGYPEGHGPGIFGTVTLGVLIAFIQYAQRFFRPIMELSDKFNILQAAMAAAERIFKLLDQSPHIVSPTHIETPSPTSPVYGQIEFRNVWFTYQHLTPKQNSDPMENPVILSEANEQPVILSEANEQPVILSEANEQPVILSEPNEQPVILSEPNEQPVILSEANGQPVILSEPNEQPVILSEANGQPVILSEARSAQSKDPAEASLTTSDRSFLTTSSPSPNSTYDSTPKSTYDPTQDPTIEWILKGVSFTIHPNETAAIVGHTGAGKTTITALMMRFYDIQRGQILVDGVDIRCQDLKSLRSRFGVVLQDPFLFSGTIAENIKLGTPTITPARIEKAADEVNVGDFIRTLPQAFNEPVRERGAGLSTGQKQLISFARALAHDPGILILDEATSSVDTDTEHRVRLALTRMITGRTSVLIAHRLSTIQSADTILVMHKGQLREQGTHQQLLAHHGLYYKLYQLQYQDQEALTA